MSSLADGDNMVYAGRERVRKSEREVHGLTADAADILRGVNFLLVGFKLRPLSAVVVGSEVGSRPGLVGHGGSAPFVSDTVFHAVVNFFALGVVEAVESANEVPRYAAYALERHGVEVVAQINVIAVERDVHRAVTVRISVVRVIQIRLQFRFGDIGVSA